MNFFTTKQERNSDSSLANERRKQTLSAKLTDFFRGTSAKSVVFIDISADSVAGAYAHYKEGELPVLLYTRRYPIEIHKDEPHERAMLRALTILGSTLIREGAPILMRATGQGRAETILVSIDAPWQKTSVRTERFERKTSFVFTKNMVATALEKTSVVPPGKFLADESIIGTILNGYEMRDPYGKKVHRAEIIILTSLIDERVARGIATLIQDLYHAERILLIAGSSLRYQAMLKVFPHERDALILDAASSLTSIALVRKGFLVAVIEVPSKYNATSWAEHIGNELAILAQQYPLPRTIFLLAREPEITSLREQLGAADMGKFWLSDNPPKIVAVLSSHLTGLIRQTTTNPPDLQLLLMVIFGKIRSFDA